MSGLQKFFKENIQQVDETVKVKLSERMPELTLRPVKQSKIFDLADKYLNIQTNNKGRITTKSNSKGYFMDLITQTVVEPDLLNQELQDTYGVMSAEELMDEMFTADEFKVLTDKVNEINGNTKKVDEIVDEVKN